MYVVTRLLVFGVLLDAFGVNGTITRFARIWDAKYYLHVAAQGYPTVLTARKPFACSSPLSAPRPGHGATRRPRLGGGRARRVVPDRSGRLSLSAPSHVNRSGGTHVGVTGTMPWMSKAPKRQ